MKRDLFVQFEKKVLFPFSALSHFVWLRILIYCDNEFIPVPVQGSFVYWNLCQPNVYVRKFDVELSNQYNDGLKIVSFGFPAEKKNCLNEKKVTRKLEEK